MSARDPGPFVVVNKYAGECWRDASMGYTTDRVEFPDRQVAEVYADAYRLARKLDEHESTVMPLAQFLIEYGE